MVKWKLINSPMVFKGPLMVGLRIPRSSYSFLAFNITRKIFLNYKKLSNIDDVIIGDSIYCRVMQSVLMTDDDPKLGRNVLELPMVVSN